MRSLRQCLMDSNPVRLEVIARLWDVSLTSGRQREIAAQLAKEMAIPLAVGNAWENLPPEQRQALDALLAAGGRMPLRVFVRQWGEIRTMGPARLQREQPWLEPVSTAEALYYSGFVYRGFEMVGDQSYEVVFVPSELRAHLPLPASMAPVINLSPAPIPAVPCSAGDTLLDDACTLLAYLQNEQVRLSPEGTWPARHTARLAQRLYDPDADRLSFLRHLIQRVGWVRSSSSGSRTEAGLLRPDPGSVTAWLQSPVNQQRATLARAWRDDPTWNDLFRVSALHPEDTGAWHNDPLLARRAVLSHLRVCEPATWYELDDFIAAIKQADPDFQRPDGDYTTWYIRDATTGAYLSGFESWDAVEGALIRYLVTGPLFWLGLTDLGSVVPGGPPTAFLLAPAGQAFLGLDDPPAEGDMPPLVLRPGFTVLVPPAQRYERFQLARIARWVRTGDPFVYRLTPTSLQRARHQGIPMTRVLEFLDQATGAGTPLPRFVEAALLRWEARGMEVRLERALLLRLSTEELMVQLMSHSHTRRLIAEQIGPAAALIRESDWTRLVVALGEMGLLTDVTDVEETVFD
jgi:hypothetical protein